MSGKDLDALAKGLADERISRGSALKRIGGVFLGGLLASLPMTAAFADPRRCADCVCGVGRPCNPKETFCVEIGRGFPTAANQCAGRCEALGLRFCGAGTQYHCPRGCEA